MSGKPPPNPGAGRSRGRATDPPPGQPITPTGPPRPGPMGPSRPGPPGTSPALMSRTGPSQQPPPPGRGGQMTTPPPGALSLPGRSRTTPPAPGRPGPLPPGRAKPTPGDLAGKMAAMSMAPPSISSKASSVTTSAASGGSGTSATASKTASAAAGSDGTGSGGTGRGRGVTRGGRREPSFIMRTKPEQISSKKGDGGTPFNAKTNYFKFSKRQGWVLLQHRVDFKPEEDNTKIRQLLVRTQERPKNPEGLLKSNFIFDGTMLFTTEKFEPPLVFNVKNPADGQVYEITIRLIGEIQPTDYQHVQLCNILVRNCMEKMGLALVGRNYYNPSAKTDIPQYKLELWPGYVTSIRQHEQDLLLCCELSTKILRTDTALDQLKFCYQQCKGNMSAMKSAAGRLLIGNIVITRYNNKTYRIDDIIWDENPSSKFQNKGKEVTFLQYYQERYKCKIQDAKQPLLISNPTAQQRRRYEGCLPSKLVPELCFMTGLSDEQRADFKLMKSVQSVTLAAPPKRVESLSKFAKSISQSKEITDELLRWNLKFRPELADIPARTLNPEKIYAGKNVIGNYKSPDDADWSGMFRNFTLLGPVSCERWAVIFSQRDAEPVNAFVSSLGQVSQKMSFILQRPKMIQLQQNRTQEYIQALNKTLKEDNLKTVMVVIPNNKSDAYGAIKKVTCVQTPIPSQVVTATVIKKFHTKGNLNSVAQKVAVQMAAKLGAEPWSVQIPVKGVMIIGYDTWHDASQKGLSIGAVVSTLNDLFTRTYSSCTFHHNNEELLSQMKGCIQKALKEYYKFNRILPSKVIVYRDGVGDGQIGYVKDQEVSQIKSYLAEAVKDAPVENKPEIALTYVIVSKRVNSRFFKIDKGGYTNPPSGSVFDDVVTLPERYDFYLISQSVRQGTVNPTSYNVIEDNSMWPPKNIQMLTYKLTHLYYNWPGTVRVPMVCQYAHKLAYLVGQSIHSNPNEALGTLLYYL